jgi:hypothetical protein
VFGAPDERLGEVPVAIIHCEGTDRGGTASRFPGSAAGSLQDSAADHLHDDPLPRLGTGKIDRVALKAQVRRLNARPRADRPSAGPQSRIGVLLINLGTPDAPEAAAVRRYLAEFLSDPG